MIGKNLVLYLTIKTQPYLNFKESFWKRVQANHAIGPPTRKIFSDRLLSNFIFYWDLMAKHLDGNKLLKVYLWDQKKNIFGLQSNVESIGLIT